MSDTITQECTKCGNETDCINGICQECFLKIDSIQGIRRLLKVSKHIGTTNNTKCKCHICTNINLALDKLNEVEKDLVHEIDMGAQASLGCATTGQLLCEIKARIEVDEKLDYRTIDSD